MADILRFNREAVHLLEQGLADSMMLGVFVEERGYSQIFRDYYLYPTVAAIWSTSPRKVLEFPAATLIRFFQNHGLLTVNGHPSWMVLRGGSSVYVEKLVRPLGGNVHLSSPVLGVSRRAGQVIVKCEGEAEAHFDQVVFAAHAPQALAMLTDASELEREVMGSFRVTSNEAVLHTDTSILPRREAAWASWNYRISQEKGVPATLTYDMNRLQSLDTPERYLVTLNSTDRLNPAKILRRMHYQHPLYNLEAIRAQQRWAEISGRNGVHFCGAYWMNGFHEDGYKSALHVVKALGVQCEIL
jgi:predicted NAD/FAD-binding protein